MTIKLPVTVFISIALTVAALADEPDLRPKDDGEVPLDQSIGESGQSRAGVSVHIDPETGEILGYRRVERPLDRLDDRLREALSRSSEGLEPVVLPDGSVQVDLQGRFRHLGVARIGNDGQPYLGCFDHPTTIINFLEQDDMLLNDAGGKL